MKPEALQVRARALKLHGLLSHWDEIRDSDWIEPLIQWEEEERAQRSLERRLKNARLGRFKRCPPWRAKRRRVVPGSREATRDTRRAEGAKGDPKGASERGVQSYGRPVCSRNELAMLWRNAG